MPIIKHKKISLDERRKSSKTLLSKHPLRVPLIISSSQSELQLEQNEFLVPKMFRVFQFTAKLRKMLILPPDHILYIYVNQKLISPDRFIYDVYELEREEDGFLYINLRVVPGLG